MNVRDLIEGAMDGVKIVICDRCNGLGRIGKGDFSCPCVFCMGCGETTVNSLEVVDGEH